MKNFLIPTAALVILASCTDTRKTETKTNEHTTIIEKPVEKKEPDGTTLKINDEGVTYTNKDGSHKSDVNIGDSTSVIIKN